jgi:hypothetical protein
MTSLDIITNLQGFEEALEGVHSRMTEEATEIRLAVTRKVKAGELGATQTGPLLLIGCAEADRYMVGVAIMSVFDQVPKEHVSPTAKYNEEMLKLVTRQTLAMEDLVKIVRAK